MKIAYAAIGCFCLGMVLAGLSGCASWDNIPENRTLREEFESKQTPENRTWDEEWKLIGK